METIENLENASSEGWTDQEIVERVKTGDTALYEIIMRRYNQRLYRVARAMLRAAGRCPNADRTLLARNSRIFAELVLCESKAPVSSIKHLLIVRLFQTPRHADAACIFPRKETWPNSGRQSSVAQFSSGFRHRSNSGTAPP